MTPNDTEMHPRKESIPLSVVIVSWKGMHDNALRIAKDAMSVTARVSIVYSDPNPSFSLDSPCRLIRRNNDLFWEDKFQASLGTCGSDWLMIIHADCTCTDWKTLLSRCIDICSTMPNVGVWVPRIRGTYYDVSVSSVIRIKDSTLHISALTDGIVFCLAPSIVNRMRTVKFGGNPLGWGIDLLFCSASHVSNKFVLIDEAVEVFHPRGTRGYNSKKARMGMEFFYTQFSPQERAQCEMLRAFVQMRGLVNSNTRKS